MSSSSSSSSNQTPKYALHRAVIRDDAEEVKKLLEGPNKVDINERDARGIPPYHYAVHMGNMSMLKLLLQLGADPTKKSAGGWNGIQEGIAASNRAMVREVLNSVHNKLTADYEQRLPVLVDAIKKIPDFYMELKWEFFSWVPLVSRLCPSDTYRIYKRGASFRVDTTLVGFENMKWIRGDISFIFSGESGGEVYVVDHKKQTIEKAFATQSKKKDFSLHPEGISDAELKRMMVPELTRTAPLTDNVTFTASKTWLGYEKTEKIGDDAWKAKVFEFEGFDLRIMSRKKVKRKGDIFIKSAAEARQELLDKVDMEDNKHGLMFPTESFSEKNKSYKGTVWISEEFPRTVEELIPIFETLAPTQKHFDKLNKFISLKMPSGGFPVKLDLPCFPTVTGSVTFLTHQDMDIDESKFTLPPDYKLVSRHGPDVRREAELESPQPHRVGDGEDGDDEEELLAEEDDDDENSNIISNSTTNE